MSEKHVRLMDRREIEAEVTALRAEVERLKKDVLRQMAWKTEAQDERDALSDVLSRNGFVPCDIAACNCGSWHARYGLPERWDELRDDLADAGHPLCNENGNLMRNALASLVAERDLFRRETVALAKDAMKVDAEVRALRDALQNCVAVLENADASSGDCCCGITMDSHDYTDGHSPVDSGFYAKDLALGMADDALALLTGEPGPGGGR